LEDTKEMHHLIISHGIVEILWEEDRWRESSMLEKGADRK